MRFSTLLPIALLLGTSVIARPIFVDTVSDGLDAQTIVFSPEILQSVDAEDSSFEHADLGKLPQAGDAVPVSSSLRRRGELTDLADRRPMSPSSDDGYSTETRRLRKEARQLAKDYKRAKSKATNALNKYNSAKALREKTKKTSFVYRNIRNAEKEALKDVAPTAAERDRLERASQAAQDAANTASARDRRSPASIQSLPRGWTPPAYTADIMPPRFSTSGGAPPTYNEHDLYDSPFQRAGTNEGLMTSADFDHIQTMEPSPHIYENAPGSSSNAGRNPTRYRQGAGSFPQGDSQRRASPRRTPPRRTSSTSSHSSTHSAKGTRGRGYRQ